MNATELKRNLFNKLVSVTDENLLLQIQSLIDNADKNQLSNWTNLSKNQQNGIIDAISEMDNSNGISYNVIIDKYKKKYA